MDLGGALFAAYLVAAAGASVALAVITAQRARARGRRAAPWAVLGLLFGVLALGALWWLERRADQRVESSSLNADS